MLGMWAMGRVGGHGGRGRAGRGPGDWGSPTFSLAEVKDFFEGCFRAQGKKKP